MSRLILETDRLMELALGETPTEAERASLENDAGLAAELAQLQDELAVALEPLTPPQGLRERLLADTAEPWWRAMDALRTLLDLSVDAVKATFRRAREATWEYWDATGVDLFHFDGGPRTAGADVGLVRAGPNHRFVDHRHVGAEHVVILEGAMWTDGRWLRVGDADFMGADSTHEWTAGPDGVVFAVVLRDGIDLLGVS